ncbi:MAG: NAD-dependent epimerase/dehydratase family protein [Tumebacillaceae bacterium]
MKVLVTGGAGFIGSHIVDECLRAGHEVVVVDNLTTGREENLNPAAKFYNMSVTNPQISALIADEQIEGIIHEAAQIKVVDSIKDPLHDADVNIMGSVNLLQAAREHGVKKFIFAASAASYGTPDYLPVDEEHPLRPMSFYGLSKKAVEEYVRLFHERYNLSYMMFRYANIYGPRQGAFGEGGVVSIFMERMIKGEPVNIEGDGGATRDYLYVGDVARANVLALESPVVGTFNLSTQTEVSVNELFETMKKLTGYQHDAVTVAARVGDIYRSSLKNESILTALPWRPETSLEEGLRLTIEWGQTEYGTTRANG